MLVSLRGGLTSMPVRNPFIAGEITVVREQDGIPEREFKAKLVPVLRSFQVVEAAYLALIRYVGLQGERVALCLVSQDSHDSGLVTRIEAVLGDTFSSDVSLDIVFCSSSDAHAFEGRCKAFYKVQRG
jgi:hypothetical protein